MTPLKGLFDTPSKRFLLIGWEPLLYTNMSYAGPGKGRMKKLRRLLPLRKPVAGGEVPFTEQSSCGFDKASMGNGWLEVEAKRKVESMSLMHLFIGCVGSGVGL